MIKLNLETSVSIQVPFIGAIWISVTSSSTGNVIRMLSCRDKSTIVYQSDHSFLIVSAGQIFMLNRSAGSWYVFGGVDLNAVQQELQTWLRLDGGMCSTEYYSASPWFKSGFELLRANQCHLLKAVYGRRTGKGVQKIKHSLLHFRLFCGLNTKWYYSWNQWSYTVLEQLQLTLRKSPTRQQILWHSSWGG